MTHADNRAGFNVSHAAAHVAGASARTASAIGADGRPFIRGALQKVHVGNVDPPMLALLRYLLNPSIVVISLLSCVLAYGDTISPTYTTLAILAFFISGQILGEVDLTLPGSKQPLGAAGPDMLLEWLYVVVLLLLLAFATKVTAVYSRKAIFTWFAITPFMLVGAHALARHAMHRLVVSGRVERKQLIIGANELGCELARKLSENPYLGTVQGFFDDREPHRLVMPVNGPPPLGALNDVSDYVRKHSINVVYIALPLSAQPRIVKLLDELRDTTASVYFVPDIFVCDLIQARFVDINGMPAVAVCETPFGGMNGIAKRTSDIVLAAVILLVVWPFMLAIAVGVRLGSPGPALFKQRRYGLDGGEILVYKFRSMTVCEDGKRIVQARRNDRRVTPFGRFLRRTSLDELPQIFNVLQGNMSIVGPRPHAVAHNEQYRKLVDGYMLRHKVRPGITGWAQVNGLRGETDTVEKMTRRVEYDLEYLRNWSLWLDLKIVARTTLIMLRDCNAY